MKVNFSTHQVADLFKDIDSEWWIAGGWAIDLFLGEQTRQHEDIDVAILREDESVFRERLQTWELWPGRGNDQLADAPIALGEELPADCGVLWCRPSANSEWAFELLLNESSDNEWLFKRDESIHMPVTQIGSVTEDGVPFLKPEIVLLFKAKNHLKKDQHDYQEVIPRLDADERKWLKDAVLTVHPGHVWLSDREPDGTDKSPPSDGSKPHNSRRGMSIDILGRDVTPKGQEKRGSVDDAD